MIELLSIHVLVLRMVYRVASLFPIQDRVVLATSHGRPIGGNLAVIHEHLQGCLQDDRIRVLAYPAVSGFSSKLKRALNEIYAEFLLGTSRVFVVDNNFYPLYVIRRRPGATVVQTWHAAGAFKKFGLSVQETHDDSASRLHSNYSVCLASSRRSAEAFSEAFGQPIERFNWDIGIPRTDALIAPNLERIRSVRASLGVPDDRKIILYAPTYRGNTFTKTRPPESIDLRVLARELGSDHVVLFRSHPRALSSIPDADELEGFVIDVSDWPDINELMLVSDALVTDYSSIIFDYSLLRRPIVFFTPDHETYEQERGLYFDYRTEGPGPVFSTTLDVATYLRRGEFDLDRVDLFRKRWFAKADGHATQRFADELVLPALRLSATYS